MEFRPSSYANPQRYQAPPKRRRSEIPQGWQVNAAPAAVPARERIISMFERALAGPIYDENREVWDEILNH
jgi:hypothetical protein